MRATIKEKLAYGCGGFSLELFSGVLSFYLMLFHTDVLGITPAASGTIFLVARLADAVTDLVMANVADRTRTKRGSYRPFILVGAVPLGIVFAANFFAPGDWSYTAKLVWAYVAYLLSGSVMMTFCGVPYGSLNNVMSTSREDRAVFGTARTVGTRIAYFVMSALTMTIILSYGSQSNPTGWKVVGVLFGVLGALGYLLCYAGTRERIQQPPRVEKVPIKQSLRVFRHNVPLWGCVGILFFYLLATTYFSTYASYFTIHYLGEADWTAPLASVRYLCSMTIAFTIPGMAKRFEKRYMVMFGVLLYMCGFVMLYFVTNFPLLIFSMILCGVGDGFIIPNIWSSIPEASDYGEWKNRISAPAFVYALCMFALKVASGISTYSVGYTLSWIGYDGNLAVQTEATRAGIRFWGAIGPLILAVGILAFSLLLKQLDRKNLMPILDELDARRKEEGIAQTE